MIQRIQSLYLLIAAVLAAAVLSFDIWSGSIAPDTNQGVEKVVVLNAYSMVMTTAGAGEVEANPTDQNTFWIAILCALSSLVGLVTIFIYRKRRLQMTFSRLGMLLLTAVLVIMFVYVDMGKEYMGDAEFDSMYDISAFLPIASIVFFFLASRAIAADEKLVRSADRLR